MLSDVYVFHTAKGHRVVGGPLPFDAYAAPTVATMTSQTIATAAAAAAATTTSTAGSVTTGQINNCCNGNTQQQQQMIKVQII